MKKIYLLILMLTLTGGMANAQWTLLYGYPMSNPPNPGQSSWFEDAVYSYSDTGIYAYHFYISPSSGSYTTGNLTKDNGQTWSQVYQRSPGVGGFGDVSTKSLFYGYPHTFYIIYSFYGFPGWYNDLFKISDDGSNYQSMTFPQANRIIDLSIPDANNVFLLSSNTHNFCSISKCFMHNYFTIDSLLPRYSRQVFFKDSLNGFLSVADSHWSNTCHTILKSNTGGSSWINSFYDSSFNINKIFFLSPETGFAVGDSGKVVKTLDSGATWQYTNTNQPQNLHDILFFNDTLGYVAGDSNLIMQSTNGGLSWEYDTISTYIQGNFTKLMPAPPTPFAAYALLRRGDGALLYSKGINKKTNNVTNFEIYPNPTTNTLSISIPNTDLNTCTINLYDIVGQKIQSPTTIENGLMTLYIQALAKGIYILEVNLNGEKVVKKVVKM